VSVGRFLFLLTNFIFNCSLSFSQSGEWSWMSGDTISQNEGVYGQQGVPSIFNHPPSLYEGCEWTDNSGNFWYYGGIHSDSVGTILALGDMWKFNPTTLEWTWMSGPGIPSQPPVYGTLRVPLASNYPGTRCFGPIGITDKNGIFWMYGGYDFFSGQFFSDLWSYDPSSNEWTWMSGQTTNAYQGTFGIMGVPSPLNFPNAKQECNAGWADSLNNIWIFGGLIPLGNGNDLWRFDVATYEWTWMKGDSTNGVGIYGVRGVPDPANTPGSRSVYSKWTDSDHNFWLFAGVGNAGAYNDLWRYEVGTNQWTWMHGSNGAGGNGFSGSLCTPGPLYVPGFRNENRAAWKDRCDNMYMYGGFGQADLWVYNRFTNEWSRLFLSTIVPSFGTKGVSSSTNKPGDKGGSSAWIDNNQNLWLFGGITGGLGYMGDMWRYVPDTACIAGCAVSLPTAIFNSIDHLICPGTCTNFTNLSLQATSYIWSFPGGTPNFSTDVDPQNICYNVPGNYSVTLIAINGTGSDTLTLNNYITVYPQPSPQGIVQSGDTLFANQGSTTYQWYYNGNSIVGATNYFYVAIQSGDYNVVVMDENGCEVEAVINDVIASVGSRDRQLIYLYPNPVRNEFTIHDSRFTIRTAEKLISIYNVMGEKILAIYLETSGQKSETTVEVIGLAKGIYWVEIVSGDKIFRTKFVKQ
jgi:hypothetical protein